MVGPDRKHVSTDALYSLVHTNFAKIPDHRISRPAISLADALMWACSMFSLKCLHDHRMHFVPGVQPGDHQACWKTSHGGKVWAP